MNLDLDLEMHVDYSKHLGLHSILFHFRCRLNSHFYEVRLDLDVEVRIDFDS